MKTSIRTNLSLAAVAAAGFILASSRASAQTTIFYEDFEFPVVSGYSQGTAPTGWVKAAQGYRASYNGLINEDVDTTPGVGFEDPTGAQGYAFRYTNSGVTTAEGVIGGLALAVPYTVSVDVVKDISGSTGTPYNIQLIAFAPGAQRDDCRSTPSGSVVLDSKSGNATGDGLYSTVTLNYTAGASDAALLGYDLGIRFKGATDSAIVDNVVVEADYSNLAYWDRNASAEGAGATPNGTWDSSATNWNELPDGTGSVAAWTPSLNAVFAAGTDAATGYTVTVDGSQDIVGMIVEEGSPTLADGTSGALNLTASADLYVASGSTTTVEVPFTDASGTETLTKIGDGTLVLDADNSGATGGMALNGGVTQFESTTSINGTTENVTVTAPAILAFGSSFGAGNIATALADRIVPTSTGIIAADNYGGENFDFDTPGLTAAYFGAVGSVNYTGTFTPAGTAYRLGGGGGTLTLNSALTSTYSLDLKGPGTVQLNGFDATMGDFSGSGGVLENGHASTNVTLTVDSANDTLFNGSLADGGAATLALTKNGSKQLTLNNGTSTYSGGSLINAGQLYVRAGSLGTGDVTFNGGDIVPVYGNYPVFTNNFHVNSGVTAALISANQYYTIGLNGVVSGDDTTTLDCGLGTSNGAGNSGYTVWLGNSANTYAGTVISRGTLRLNSLADSTQPVQLIPHDAGRSAGIELYSTTAAPLNFANRQFQLTAVGTAFLRNNNGTASNTISVNDLVVNSGSAALKLNLEGNNTGDNTISSDIANGASSDLSVVKNNNGKWVLTGDNSYTGVTDINAGTLVINGDCSTATGNVTLDGGTLGGAGTLGGSVTVAAGANLAPGASAGTLSILGNLDISAPAGGAGKLNFELDTLAASDKIAVTGTLTIGTDVLGFTDFVFTDLGGLQNGAYTLISSGGISGSLNPLDLGGSIGLATGTLQINGNNIELVVTGLAGNTYADWIGGYSVGGQDGFGDDPDGDTNSNGLENFFGTDPTASSAGLSAGTKSGNTFTFTHPQNASPASDVTAAYRWSTDLATFHADGASSGGTTVDFTTQPDTPTLGTTTVTATITGTVPDELFADVEVTQS